MQKSNSARRIRPQPTQLPEIAHFLPSSPHMSQEFIERTGRSWPRIRAARKGNYAVVDVDADKRAILRPKSLERGLIESWTVFAVLRCESSGCACVDIVWGARQAFEDDAAAHWDHLGSAPFAEDWAMRDREEGGRMHDVECCKHWDNVSVMDARKAGVRSVPLNQETKERRIDVFRCTQQKSHDGRRLQDSYINYGVARGADMCARGTRTAYKLKKSFPASGPFSNRSAVAFSQSQPIVAPKRLPGPAR